MKDKIFRYEQVVLKIEEIIKALQLKPGDKIPSVRSISTELKVSMATVFQAYYILEARGVITPRAKSGFYISSLIKNTASCNLTPKNYIPLPAKVEMNTMATTMMKNAREFGVINFSILAPVNENLPITKLNKSVQIALKEMSGNNYQYPLVEGDPRLIKQISLHTIKWENVIPQEKILITNGCMEAINLCLDAITTAGDTVAVESPTYHGLLQSLESRKLKALEIPAKPGSGLDLTELKKAIKAHKIAACIFMPRANNPLGSSMTEADKQQLVKILGKRNIPLIEDDAMGELQFSKLTCLPAKAYDTYENVLYCSSFSKSLAPGFRIGCVSGGKYHAKIEKLKYGANISTNAVLQAALAHYLESGQYGAHLRKMTTNLQAQVAKYAAAVQAFFPAEVKVAQPLAGFSLWIELPVGIDALQFQRLALEKGIGICPGPIFSMTGRYDNFIRINCCPSWVPKTKSALKKLGKLAVELSGGG